MNGAQAVLQTLVDAGITTCFTNPGTSEMHLVAGMVAMPEMRGILCLFEGVATGAADGYGRMAAAPAATLLHLGPGLGNGLANLHNARRAGTPVVNVVGDHATYHKPFDAPLDSDIEGMAGPVSKWVRRTESAARAGIDTAAAIAAARTPTGHLPGGVATLILPSDVCWSEDGTPAAVPAVKPAPIDLDAVERVAKVLRSESECLLFIGGGAMRREALAAASRIAQATGARLLAEKSPARHERGAGIPCVDRLPYPRDLAAAKLAGARHIIFAGARPPVSFFAYPGKPSALVPDGCEVHDLGSNPGALHQLADLLAPGVPPLLAAAHRPRLPKGNLTAQKAAAVLGALLPEGAIVVDEAMTSDEWLPEATAGAPAHDWLNITGGSIGMGMPVATGAAVACPDRPVITLEADGSAMYTLQALWTQAREGLDVTTVIFNNASYAILEGELRRLGGFDGAAARRSRTMIDIPGLDFVALANGMGVPATRARTAEALAEQLRLAMAEPGPHLIEAVVPPVTATGTAGADVRPV
ncbi:acetolactate synthase large subunit [Streptomyces sp. HD]|uniref:acetolactate synthase large subunit n=1 Tax=Streptomyces sp. HD TaxID=3020892 RepID=UPI0023305186|nr:acetolactate synthase large subunit [Streptomyces sp. HD]MDC0773371.1 acetolactate synthase large subunit [Streptomyces sp. HD]